MGSPIGPAVTNYHENKWLNSEESSIFRYFK